MRGRIDRSEQKRITMLIFFFVFFWSFSHAQKYPHALPRYDFINYDTNQLHFIVDSSAFERLFDKFDKLIFDGEGQINVVHMGGSHIQADMWSGRMRKNLQHLAPGCRGGRGFIFPFKMAKTNNPYYYYPQFTGEWEGCRNVQKSKNCLLGLSGMSVTTRDTSANIMITFRGKDYRGYDFNSVKVFHSMEDSSYCLDIVNRDSLIARLINDSIGYTEFRLNRFTDTLQLHIEKTESTQTHFTLYGILLENDDPGFIYHAIGVNGASVPSYLRCSMLEQHLSVINPDLVILSIGINDAYDLDFDPQVFQQNYHKLISRIRSVAPDAAILLTTNNDSYRKRRYPNKNGELVRDAMMNMALSESCGVWDMFSVMGGYKSMLTWQKHGLAKKDKIHFTRDGYHLVADLMFQAIVKSYDNHLAKKFNSE